MRLFISSNGHESPLNLEYLPPIMPDLDGKNMEFMANMNMERLFECLNSMLVGMLYRSLCVRSPKFENFTIYAIGCVKRSMSLNRCAKYSYFSNNPLMLDTCIRMLLDSLSRHGIYKWSNETSRIFDDYYAKNKSFSKIMYRGHPLRDKRMLEMYASSVGLDKDFDLIYKHTCGSVHASNKDREFPLSWFEEEGFQTDEPLISLDYEHMYKGNMETTCAFFAVLTNFMIRDTSETIGGSVFWGKPYQQDFTNPCGIRIDHGTVEHLKANKILDTSVTPWPTRSEDWSFR